MIEEKSYAFINYTREGAVATIEMNCVERRNAQSMRMLDEMDDAFRQANSDPEVRVVILAGAGDHFSSGHDLKDAQERRGGALPTVEGRYEYEDLRFYQYCLHILDLPKPTIAQVQGACVAAGFMVANVCDLIVASDDAFFADAVGHSFGTASVEFLIHPWVMSMRKTKEFLLTGQRISAAEALDAGIVNKVVPREQLHAACTAMANRIAEYVPFGAMLVKRSLARTQEIQGLRAALSAHFDTHQLSHLSAGHNEKMAGGYTSRIGATRSAYEKK